MRYEAGTNGHCARRASMFAPRHLGLRQCLHLQDHRSPPVYRPSSDEDVQMTDIKSTRPPPQPQCRAQR